MRIVVHKYIDSSDYMFETTDDGEVVTRELGGERGRPGRRTSGYLEVLCEEDEESVDRLLEAIAWMRGEMERRKRAMGEKGEKPEAKKGRKPAGVTNRRRA